VAGLNRLIGSPTVVHNNQAIRNLDIFALKRYDIAGHFYELKNLIILHEKHKILKVKFCIFAITFSIFVLHNVYH